MPSPKGGTYLPSKQHPPWAKPPLWRVTRGISQDLKRTNPLIQQFQSKKFTLQRDSPCVQRAACQRDWKSRHAHKRGWSDKRWLSHIASKWSSRRCEAVLMCRRGITAKISCWRTEGWIHEELGSVGALRSEAVSRKDKYCVIPLIGGS